ncbi:MAG: hypothetical protein JWL96_2431 [Sphingomonas bacterium]|uniref:hypothetical protein n=1 Tax=Sphingomonas bacterium TaxID=1895847 RepID=UPI0026318C0C|nr:hypothetical protein [Sphingomonas bacterium]MDB5710361.1 hypothetical protein [Sphingomonas bacterium]
MQNDVLKSGSSASPSVPNRADAFPLADAATWPGGITISPEPVRRVHTRSRRRNTSLIYSTLPLGMRVSESQSETRFLKVVQLEPRATVVRAQPVWLRVLEEGRMRRRAPDFAVVIDGRAELHETKQDAECRKPDVISELLSIRDEVERHPGWRYSVTLESALLAEPLRSNTDLLWRELVPDEEIDLDLRLRTSSILDDGPITAIELIERTTSGRDHQNARGSWENLLAMIAGRLVDFDVSKFLTLESLLWNRNSGPPRRRTLPFGSVEDAIRSPLIDRRPAVFCGLQIRRSST